MLMLQISIVLVNIDKTTLLKCIIQSLESSSFVVLT